MATITTRMAALLLCALLALLAITAHAQPTGELQAVYLVARHGDRSPTRIPKDWQKYWNALNVSAGELTAVGRSQHQSFGRFLRNKYVDTEHLLTTDFINSQVYVRSTDYDRCLSSAASFLRGMFPAATPPVHTVTAPLDQLLQPTGKCPSYVAMADRVADEAEEEFRKEHADVIEHIRTLTGWGTRYRDADMLEYAQDNYIGQAAHDDMMPVDPYMLSVSELLQNFTRAYWYHSYGMPSPTDPRGPSGSELALLLLNQLSQPVASQKKFTLYLAHDSTLTALLSAFGRLDNVNNPRILPVYASSFLLELRKQASGELTVSALWGQPVRVPSESRQTPEGWTYDQVPLALHCGSTEPQETCTLAALNLYINQTNKFYKDGCCLQTADYHSQCTSFGVYAAASETCQLYRRLCTANACGTDAERVLTSQLDCVTVTADVSTWRAMAIVFASLTAILLIVVVWVCCRSPASSSATSSDGYNRA